MKCRDVGPLDASIMLIGEAPGASEEQQGIPFVGASGKLMKAMLRHSGIDYAQCYVTNVMNERPPGNKFNYFYESKGVPSKTLEEGQAAVREKISKIKPKKIILLGNEALKAVTNKTGIMNWRGCWLSYKNIPVMPTIHPAAVLRQYGLHPIFELDVKKANVSSPKPWPETVVAPTIQDAITCLEEVMNSKYASFDIETVDKEVRSIAFAYEHGKKVKAISIPFIKFPSSDVGRIVGSVVSVSGDSCSNYWTVDNELMVLNAIQKLFDSDVIWIGQNSISFDEPLIIRSFHMRPKKHEYDLMHMWHLLYCEFPKSLNFICSTMTDYNAYWAEKDTLVDLDEWTYNARDTIVTYEAGIRIIEELEENKQTKFYKDHIRPLCSTLVRLEQRGVFINDKVRLEHKKKQEERKEKAQKRLNELAGHEVNANSPKQIQKLLYKEMHFPAARNPKTGGVTTDEEAIRKLSKMYPKEPVFQEIINYRKASKLLGTYLDLKTGDDGRLHSSYNASGTGAARLSSSQNIFGEGTNLQNIPAGKGLDIVNLRDMFAAESGRLFLKGDLKQAETMVVAEILARLGFPQMHDLYQDPDFDVHRWAAAFTFSVQEAAVLKNQRNVAKIRNHSGNYMAGPNVMVKTALKYGVDIDFQMAKKLLNDHRKQVPGLTNWWSWVEKQLNKTRTLYTCFGRKRTFFDRIDRTTLGTAVAFEPQSTVGDLTNMILVELEKRLPSGCFPILQVHDEIVVELEESKLEECIDEFKKAATVPLFVNPDFPLIIPVELEYGKDWKNMEKVK